ncbi:MAG: cytochrome c biogenesis protein ResB [Phycisphaerae bacterium]|nr:cytochrome c biogenesis protein ResB [Phycisphaerae bacterium]
MKKPEDSVKIIRKTLMLISVLLLLLLIACSIKASFWGADKATEFFNSPPMIAYWITLTAVFACGLVSFKRLITKPGLFLLHAGCVLVLIGSMINSKKGHELLKNPKPVKTTMYIQEGSFSQELYDVGDDISSPHTKPLKELPFRMALDNVWNEYYPAVGTIEIMATDKTKWEIPAEYGRSIEVDTVPTDPEKKSEKLIIEVGRIYQSMSKSYYTQKNIESPESEGPPMADIIITRPDGQKFIATVRPAFMAAQFDDDGLAFVYKNADPLGVKEYYSAISILDPVKHCQNNFKLEVNHPIHYGGYYFYQASVFPEFRPNFTILTVTSDSGVNIVFYGFYALIAGSFWHCWLRHLKPAKFQQGGVN